MGRFNPDDRLRDSEESFEHPFLMLLEHAKDLLSSLEEKTENPFKWQRKPGGVLEEAQVQLAKAIRGSSSGKGLSELQGAVDDAEYELSLLEQEPAEAEA